VLAFFLLFEGIETTEPRKKSGGLQATATSRERGCTIH
jgi:hypothetical protein